MPFRARLTASSKGTVRTPRRVMTLVCQNPSQATNGSPHSWYGHIEGVRSCNSFRRKCMLRNLPNRGEFMAKVAFWRGTIMGTTVKVQKWQNRCASFLIALLVATPLAAQSPVKVMEETVHI